jgi:hypothetical protein
VSLSGSGVVCWSLFDILRSAMFLNGVIFLSADRNLVPRITRQQRVWTAWNKEEIDLDMRMKVL